MKHRLCLAGGAGQEGLMGENIYRIFDGVWNLSLVGGYCVLLVLLARLLLQKAPKWCSYLLWGIVFVRLCCPVLPETGISLIPERLLSVGTEMMSGQQTTGADHRDLTEGNAMKNNGDALWREHAAEEVPDSHAAEKTMAVGNDNTVMNADGTQDFPLGSERIESGATVAGVAASGTDAVISGTSAETGTDARAWIYPVWFRVLSLVWLAGMLGFLGYHAYSYLRMRHRIRRLDSGVRQVEPGICEIDGGHLSFVMGLIHPVIYLSSGLDPESRKVVLCHERVHLQRRDYLWKPLALVICCVHWFNPLVWLAYWLFCRDIETACDQCVVRRLDRNEKKAYSDALLQCSQGRRMVLACPVAFGEEGVKSRIKAVLQYKKPAFWVILAAIIACIVVAVCFLTDPVSGGSKGTLTFVEKENIISTWRADFTVDTQEAALDANIYAEIWQNGQCRTTQLLTMSRYVNELSVQLTQPERNEQMRLTFSLWAATDAYGGYGDLSDDLKQMPKDTAFAAYTDGEKRQAAAGDDIVLLAVAADLGGGLPEFDCRKLEKQPDIARNADYMIVVHAAFTPSDTTPPENILGYDTESAHALLASEFRLPTEVDIVDVPEPDTVGQGFFQLASDNRWVARYGKAELTGSTPSITLHSWSSGTLTVESGTDALLWINREANAAYTGDMTGDEIISALSGWAWQMKKNIARSKEAVPDAATFFTRFPDGGFRWDIYGQNGNDSGALVSQLTDYVKGNNLTVEQCRALLLNIDGLDGAYAEGYTGTLLAVYQKAEAVYTQAWQSLTTDQQRAIPRDAEGLLPRPPITVSVAPNGYPLMAEKVEQAVRQLDMPLAISPNETYSAEEHHIKYTLRGSDGAALPLCGVNSSVRDGDKGVLRVTYVEAAGEGTSFRWEDWQKPIQLAGLLCGGFTDEEQFYRQLSSREIPEDAAVNGAEWQLETVDGHFCHVRYSAAVSATGTALPKTLMVSFYDSEATYRETWKEAMQNREANRIDQLVLMGQAKQGN